MKFIAPLLSLLSLLLLCSPAFAEAEAEAAYPFNTRYFSFHSQQQPLKMAYMRLRGENAKPTLLLLHGEASNGASWGDTAMALNMKGYNVLIPDRIGYGKSSQPDGHASDSCQSAQDTAALLDELGIADVIAVGHATGATVATHLALMQPKRISRLILISPISNEAMGNPPPEVTTYAIEGLGDAPHLENFEVFLPIFESILSGK